MISKLPILNVYKKKTKKSEVVTQLLYGDTFKKLKKIGSWIRIKNDTDNYKGYIKNKKFFLKQKNSHKVCNLYANLYSKQNVNSKIKKKLSFGSKIKVAEKKGRTKKFRINIGYLIDRIISLSSLRNVEKKKKGRATNVAVDASGSFC